MCGEESKTWERKGKEWKPYGRPMAVKFCMSFELSGAGLSFLEEEEEEEVAMEEDFLDHMVGGRGDRKKKERTNTEFKSGGGEKTRHEEGQAERVVCL